MATAVQPVPDRRGWGRLFVAVAAFFFVPAAARPVAPLDNPVGLFAVALAACTVIGWSLGGRPWVAIVVVLATLLLGVVQPPANSFENLSRGWCLLLGSSFGLVCLFAGAAPFFPRALVALFISFILSAGILLTGRLSPSSAQASIAAEFARRDTAITSAMTTLIDQHPENWSQLVASNPELQGTMDDLRKELAMASDAALAAFPALLALESLAALTLAWAASMRLVGSRLGTPLAALRQFRFNDHLVWGFIAGLVILVVPSLTRFQPIGRNLVVFFGALYAVRGLGVLAWFLSPRRLAAVAVVGAVLMLTPLVGLAQVGFLLLASASIGLGLADTWADWRNRAIRTPS